MLAVGQASRLEADEFVVSVAAAAATIWERLEAAQEVGTVANPDLGLRRLAAWCDACAGGDSELFNRRLARDGLDRERVVAVLGAPDPPPSADGWVASATWIERALRQLPSRTASVAATETLPFAPLYEGLIEAALSDFRVRTGPDGLALLGDLGAAALREEFARLVAELCAPILYDHFVRFRTAGGGAKVGDGTAYASFLVQMRAGGFRAVFRQSPVLLRLLAVAVEQWIASTSEFLRRLALDKAAVAELAGINEPLRVIHVEVVGDVHNHGRSVRRVGFEGGQTVFYKPKDLMVDAAWHGLVQDLNGRSPPFTLRVPLVVTRSGYGWAEGIAHDSCSDALGPGAFFRRAGGWLCLLQVFGATDMHEQNIVACGDDPVPVDLETLLQPALAPEVPSADPRRGYALAGAEVADSVLATGLLPSYGRRPDGGAVVHGGLLETRTALRVINWHEVNTDRMRPTVSLRAEAEQNRPHINGRYAAIQDHSEAVVAGYTEYASFLLSEVETRGASALIDRFAGVRVRKLVKNTRFYALLIERLRDPRRMADGALWSAQLDVASRFMDWNSETDPWWPLIRAERDALVELNVPHFTMSASSSRLADADGFVADSKLRPGLDRVKAALSALNPSEIAKQAATVRLSLTPVRHVAASFELRAYRRAAAAPLRPPPRNPKPRFQREADAIAARLSHLARRGERSAAWISLDWLQDSTVCQLAPLGVGLYNGAIGVAVFLAAHAAVTGNQQSAQLSRDGLAALRHDLLGIDGARSARALGVGGSTGLGSVVYGLAIIAGLTGDESLVSDAVRISRLLSPASAGDAMDVMDGSAGAILGLLRLYRASGQLELLRQAEVFAQRLLPLKAPSGGLLPTGLSHGPAGLALALTALAAELDPERAGPLLNAAQGWLAFEEAAFCSTHGTWPDGRAVAPASDSFWPCQWCHGAAGIGLARIAMADRMRGRWGESNLGKSIDQDVRRAVTATKAAWPYATDSLCCGSLGGIEFLTEAGRHLNMPELNAIARARLWETVEEARATGDFLWDIADSSVNVGLFRGVSGMGYALLRQVAPTLPNILVWA